MPGLCMTCKDEHVIFFQRPNCCTEIHHDDLRNKERLVAFSLLYHLLIFAFLSTMILQRFFCNSLKDIGLASFPKGKRWDDKLSFPQWDLCDCSKVLICWDAKIINNVVWIRGRSWGGFGGWEHATQFLFSYWTWSLLSSETRVPPFVSPKRKDNNRTVCPSHNCRLSRVLLFMLELVQYGGRFV